MLGWVVEWGEVGLECMELCMLCIGLTFAGVVGMMEGGAGGNECLFLCWWGVDNWGWGVVL